MAKTYQVIKATQKPIDGVTVDGRHMKFGRSGGFQVSDPAVKEAIEAQYGGGLPDVVVVEDDKPAPGHKTFWGAWPEMPWKRIKQ